MSDSDSRNTDKLPPPNPSFAPPSDHFRVAELGNSLLAIDTIAHYLRGELQGQTADVANEIGTMMRRKQDAFERHVKDELAEIRAILARVERAVRASSTNIGTLVATMQPFGQRLTQLEGAHARNHPIGLSVAQPESVDSSREDDEAKEA